MIFDKISRRRAANWVCLALAMLFMLSAVPGKFSYAQGRFLREEWKLPDFYPKGFDGFGKIERIEQDLVIIGDTSLKFSSGIKFATPMDRHAGIYDFHVGDTVAYLLNAKHEIISLWYIEFRKR